MKLFKKIKPVKASFSKREGYLFYTLIIVVILLLVFIGITVEVLFNQEKNIERDYKYKTEGVLYTIQEIIVGDKPSKSFIVASDENGKIENFHYSAWFEGIDYMPEGTWKLLQKKGVGTKFWWEIVETKNGTFINYKMVEQ